MEKEVMNLQEAADFLGTSRQTLAKMARAGDVPYRPFGRGGSGERPSYRFSRTALLDWLAGKAPPGAADVGTILSEQTAATHRMATERTGQARIEAEALGRADSPPKDGGPHGATEAATRARPKGRGKGKRRQFKNHEARDMLRRLDEEFEGNVSGASKALGINRTTLQKWTTWYPDWRNVPQDDEYISDPGAATRRAVKLSPEERKRLRKECIKRYADGRGETQTAIAEALGLSQAMVSKLILGK